MMLLKQSRKSSILKDRFHKSSNYTLLSMMKKISSTQEDMTILIETLSSEIAELENKCDDLQLYIEELQFKLESENNQ